MKRGIVALVFLCKITDGELTVNDEATAFRWSTEPEIRELLAEAYAVRVIDALHTDHSPAIRKHDGEHVL